MKTVHLIHGFREDHPVGQPNMAILRDAILARGHRVLIHDYGKLGLLETSANDNMARLIFPLVRRGDTLVGFSNGCAIIAHLEEMMCSARKLVFIQPALRNDWTPNAYCDRVTVFWNAGDKATVAGKWWRRISNLFRWKNKHKWGEMGHTGYIGEDRRYRQYRTDKHAGHDVILGHSAWDDKVRPVWHKLMINAM